MHNSKHLVNIIHNMKGVLMNKKLLFLLCISHGLSGMHSLKSLRRIALNNRGCTRGLAALQHITRTQQNKNMLLRTSPIQFQHHALFSSNNNAPINAKSDEQKKQQLRAMLKDTRTKQMIATTKSLAYLGTAKTCGVVTPFLGTGTAITTIGTLCSLLMTSVVFLIFHDVNEALNFAKFTIYFGGETAALGTGTFLSYCCSNLASGKAKTLQKKAENLKEEQKTIEEKLEKIS